MSLNIVLVVFDSCRWDCFEKSASPTLRKFFNVKLAYSQATYTYASFVSMYQGLFPSTRCRTPYYNRFCKPLFRIDHRDEPKIKALLNFPKGTEDIIHGLRSLGYSTLTLGAVQWFKSTKLALGFDEFHFTGIHADRQIRLFHEYLRRVEAPFFAVINFGETHEPYKYGGKITESLESRARVRGFKNNGFLLHELNMQVECCEYLDTKVRVILESLSALRSSSLVLFCSDHGECFGEDSLYGHGFYHPKIMEVPLGMCLVNKIEANAEIPGFAGGYFN